MRTKIVATIGPKSESPEVLREIIKAGGNILRMNFSHCTFDEYKKRKEAIQQIAKEENKDVKILADLQGPRLRVGELPAEGIEMKEDDIFVFSTNKENKEAIFINDPYLHNDVKVGEPLYLVNGAIELVITEISGQDITAKVIFPGTLFSRKAVNVPNTKLTTSSLTEKDMTDIEFLKKEGGFDYMALSFVQTADDVNQLRSLIGPDIKIISKIERPIALKNIDAIVQASDAIMIARGDLGIELPMEEVPIAQKHMINLAAWHGKASIVATQMLLSMVENDKPTRAEINDVANAVFDGADAVMLSDESANGHYPVKSVETMAKIVARVEADLYDRPNDL